jgi:transposase-like protein
MKKRIRHGDPQRRQYWREVVRRWEEGGQTVRAFCRAEGVHESAFYFWRRELARRKEQAAGEGIPVSASPAFPATRRSQPAVRPQEPGPSFLPVHVVASHGSETAHAIEIVLATGRVVRVAAGFDRPTLAAVLSVLEPRPC